MGYTIGFIGAGNMAGAIINGIVKSGLLMPAEIAVFDVREDCCEGYRQRGYGVCRSIGDLAGCCRNIVLSVKPQIITSVLTEIKPVAPREAVYISIAAGISAAFIKESLGFDAKVVLVMPNTPLLIANGASAMSRIEPTTVEEFSFVKQVFGSAGIVEEISPNQMNEVIPLHGSSPAYIYLFAKIFVERAVSLGFDANTANRLFCTALIGSAHMMMEAGKSHQELIDMVTSPAGTTYEGLKALERCGFEQALTECFDDTIRRAYELGK